MNRFNQICKHKAHTVLWKKTGKMYDPKIKSAKYLELIDQNKIWLIFNSASKVQKLPGHPFIHSIFNTLFAKFQISKVQTLNFRNMKFEQNASCVGGVYTYPLQSVVILFNLAVNIDDSAGWCNWVDVFQHGNTKLASNWMYLDSRILCGTNGLFSHLFPTFHLNASLKFGLTRRQSY